MLGKKSISSPVEPVHLRGRDNLKQTNCQFCVWGKALWHSQGSIMDLWTLSPSCQSLQNSTMPPPFLQGLHRYMYHFSTSHKWTKLYNKIITTFKQKKIARGNVQMNMKIEKPVRMQSQIPRLGVSSSRKKRRIN